MNKNLLLFFFAMAVSFGLNAQIFSEDFESGIPADWSADASWSAGNANSIGSQYFPIPAHGNFVGVNDDAAGNGVSSLGSITTPSIDLSGITAPGVSMSFNAFFVDGDYQGVDEVASVEASSDGGTTWKELLSLPTGSGEWVNHSVNLTEYLGGSVMVRFHYNDNNGWQFGYCVDDVLVSALKEYDISVTRVPNDQFVLTGSMMPLSCTVQNYGVQTLTSFDVSYSDGTDMFAETVTGVSVAYGDTYLYEFPSGFSVANPNTYEIGINVDLPNGQVDEDDSNNNTSTTVSGITASAAKTVVAEEATGTWCGWCPRGAVFMDYMGEIYQEDFVGIAVHNNDPMAVTAYDDGLTATEGFTGFPSVVVDRTNIIDPSNLEAEYNLAKQKLTPVLATQDVTLDEGSRTLTIKSNAIFNTNLTAHDIRLQVVIVENEVTGSGAPYNQANYYSGGGSGEMAGYENLGNPVPAADMIYNWVGRALLAEYNGMAGSLPASIALGEEASHTFTYTVPADYDLFHLSFSTLIIDASNGQILNAVNTAVGSMTGNENESVLSTSVELYPNPFADQATLEISLEETSSVAVHMYNHIGQLVSSKNYGEMQGVQHIPVFAGNLDNGMYFLHVRVNNNTITKKLQIVK